MTSQQTGIENSYAPVEQPGVCSRGGCLCYYLPTSLDVREELTFSKSWYTSVVKEIERKFRLCQQSFVNQNPSELKQEEMNEVKRYFQHQIGMFYSNVDLPMDGDPCVSQLRFLMVEVISIICDVYDANGMKMDDVARFYWRAVAYLDRIKPEHVSPDALSVLKDRLDTIASRCCPERRLCGD